MTSLLGNTRKSDVTFHNNGKIDISARITKQLTLHEGDVIDILLHEGEFMLYVKLRRDDKIGRHEAECHSTKKGKAQGNNMRAYSARLTKILLDACRTNDVARLPAGEVVETPYGRAVCLITNNPL